LFDVSGIKLPEIVPKIAKSVTSKVNQFDPNALLGKIFDGGLNSLSSFASGLGGLKKSLQRNLEFLKEAKGIIVDLITKMAKAKPRGGGGGFFKGLIKNIAKVGLLAMAFKAAPAAMGVAAVGGKMALGAGALVSGVMLAGKAFGAIKKRLQKKKGYELESWIKNKILELNAKASPNAIKRLLWMTSGDLYTLENEINKLTLYVEDREIEVSDVNILISSSRQSNIFLFIDAVMDKKPGVALNELYSMILDGVSIGQIINMLARQVRLLILCKDFLNKNLSRDEIGKRIFINNDFVLEKTLSQSNRFDLESLSRIQKKLLSTDIYIKTGSMDQRTAVEILASDLSK